MKTKNYNIMHGVGSSKYLVNFHDGVNTHKDGSEFYDIKIFTNKKELKKFEKELLKEGYIYK